MSKLKVALIQSSPPIHDPRELNTIITTSLRSMFGDCQAHTIELRILKCRSHSRSYHNTIGCIDDDDDDDDDLNEAIIECSNDSLPFIRAALTFPCPPSYIDTMYRFDFVKVDDKASNPDWVG